MSQLTPIRYPLDASGVASSNSIQNEPHTLAQKRIRAIAPLYAPIFKDSVIVKDSSTGLPLTPTQFKFYSIRGLPSAKYGKELYDIILITDSNVGASVSITYQTLGGEYTTQLDSVKSLIDSLYNDNRPSSWPNVVDIPERFIPNQHLHSVGDVVGFEYVVTALERLTDVVRTSTGLRADDILAYVDNKLKDISTFVQGAANGVNSLQLVVNDLAEHIASKNNPHDTDKYQIGLGHLENYPLALLEDLQTPNQLNPKYVTNIVLSAYLSNVISSLDLNIQNNLTQLSSSVSSATSQSQIVLDSMASYNEAVLAIPGLTSKALAINNTLTQVIANQNDSRLRAAAVITNYLSTGN